MNKETDRELLKLAAKAVGKDVNCISNDGVHCYDTEFIWNPLTNDGDALQLCVKLGIQLQFTNRFAVAYAGSVCAKQFTERFSTDENAATCRAIVRAAAEIGKNIK